MGSRQTSKSGKSVRSGAASITKSTPPLQDRNSADKEFRPVPFVAFDKKAVSKGKGGRLAEKRRRAQERQLQEAKLRAERDLKEQNQKREKMLPPVTKLFKKAKRTLQKLRHKRRELTEWMRYLACENPYPESPTSLHTEHYVWDKVNRYEKLDKTIEGFNFFMPIFDFMEDLIKDPFELSQWRVECILDMLKIWKTEFLRKIDFGCFLLIKDIYHTFEIIDYYTRILHVERDNVKIGMWSFLDQPLSCTFKLNLPLISFPQCFIDVQLPTVFQTKPFILRVMYFPSNYLNCFTRTNYSKPPARSFDVLIEWTKLMELKEKIVKERERAEAEKQKEGSAQRKISTTSSIETIVYDSRSAGSLTSSSTRFSSRGSKYSSIGRDSFRKSTFFEDKFGSSSLAARSSMSIRSAQNRPTRKFLKPIAEGEFKSHFTNDSLAPIDKFDKDSITSHPESGLQNLQKLTRRKNQHDEMDRDSFSLADLIFTRLSSFSRRSSELKSFKPIEKDIERKNDNYNFDDIRPLKELVLGENYKNNLHNIRLLKDNFLAKSQKRNVDASAVTMPSDTSYESIKILTRSNSELFNEREEENRKNFVESMKIKDLNENELNMRCYNIYSGVYFIDFIKHVPQTVYYQSGDAVVMQEGEFQIAKEEFYCEYTSKTLPSPISSSYLSESFFNDQWGSHEEDEISRISFEQTPFDVRPPEFFDDDLLKLIYVQLWLRKDAYWLSQPIPVQWDDNKKIWLLNQVHDVRFHKNEKMVQCRLKKTGPIALAVLRFKQLPYKKWLLLPDSNNTVVLTLVCQTLIIAFRMTEDKISLDRLEGTSQIALDHIVGEYYDPDDLFNLMQRAGIDIFPEDDSFLYIDETDQGKDNVVEDHIYMTMAMFGGILEFASSAWNYAIGRKKVMFRCRKSDTAYPFRTFISSIDKTDMLLIDDEAEIFLASTNKDLGFSPDAYSMMMKLYGDDLKSVELSVSLVIVTYFTLLRTRVLMYSGDKNKNIY